MENSTSQTPEMTSETAASAPPTRPVSPIRGQAQKFVETLKKWRENDRGKLAQLKRNIGEPLPGRGVSWIYNEFQRSGIYDSRSVRAEESLREKFFFVATIYDLNRFQTPHGDAKWGTLGASMRRAVEGGANEDSTGRRLQILLDADFDEGATSELAFRLRQTVQWLAGRQIGFDAEQLIYDLYHWSNPDRFVQKNWARDFYNVRPFLPRNSDSL